jgi:flagellin
VSTANAGVGANGVGAGTVTINGYLGSKSVAVAANDTAKAIAANINTIKADTGVTATARTDVLLGGFSSTGSYTLNLTSDNTTAVSVSFTLTSTTGSDRLSAAVSAINEQSAKTGVTASLNSDGSGVVLTNATGNDITVSDTTIANAANVTVTKLNANGAAVGAAVTLTADTTADDSTTSGYLVLDSEKSFALTSTSTAITSGGSELRRVADLDVSTFEKSTEALKTVDSALAFVSGERSKLGALQARFETAIASLNITSENLSASRSRIQDADFAAETANLSRAQILQQAGTAMVAQANQIPQGVLSLLRQ